MTTLHINGQSYFCPCNWSELKWSQFIALKRLVLSDENISQKQNHVQPKSNAIEQKEQFQLETNDEKDAKLLSLFCHVDPEVAAAVDPVDRKRFIACLIRRFINPLQKSLFRENSNACDMDASLPLMGADQGKFRCGDETLCFPKSERTFDGACIPLCDVSALQWCEAADLYLADKWEYAPLIVAVLCKGDESEYMEPVVKRRAESMKNCPMSIITDLFTLLNSAHHTMKNLYPKCYAKNSSSSSPSENHSDFSWYELLLWTGHFRADEIDRVRSMNCYDFMALVNGRIKSGD